MQTHPLTRGWLGRSRLAGILLSLALLLPTGNAQTAGTGSIQGAVADQTGAVLQNATVIDHQHRDRSTAQDNERGRRSLQLSQYAHRRLHPGCLGSAALNITARLGWFWRWAAASIST